MPSATPYLEIPSCRVSFPLSSSPFLGLLRLYRFIYILLALLYLLLFFVLYFKHRDLIVYRPHWPINSREIVYGPEELGIENDRVEGGFIKSLDGQTNLHCFFIKASVPVTGSPLGGGREGMRIVDPRSRPTILMLHGNAGNIVTTTPAKPFPIN